MRLSVVIISWNSLNFLKSCLASLSPILDRSESELVWVDNGSSDGAAEFVRSHYPNAKIKVLSQNMGVAFARNRGVELSSGKYIFFLDDDTEVSSDALNFISSWLDNHPDVGIAGCALRDADGNLQNSFKGFPGILCKASNVIKSKLHLKSNTTLPDAPIYPTYIIGACQMIRREVFDHIGLLDENIFYGPEDADFCIRASKAGFRVVYLPQISILHHWRRITSRSLTSQASKAHTKALLYFWRKHHRFF